MIFTLEIISFGKIFVIPKHIIDKNAWLSGFSFSKVYKSKKKHLLWQLYESMRVFLISLSIVQKGYSDF